MNIKEELKSEDQVKHCRVCKDEINWTNTATEANARFHVREVDYYKADQQ